MKSITALVTTGIAMVLLSGLALAAPTDDPRIQKREKNQQQRIEQGEKSGQLTEKEAGRLEAQQDKIKRDEERMKADGKLTKGERRKLKREQDRASKNIYRKKHNEEKEERDRK